jgi:prophage tail gpP-like protein
MILLRLNGEPYTNFDNVAVVRSMETVSGAFSFSSSANSKNLFPVRKGDAVQVLVDGVQVLDGHVERLSSSYSDKDHKITITGRDTLGDLIDSSVFGTKEFTGNITLTDVAKSILQGIGLTSVNVIDRTGGVRAFDETDITSAEVGQNAFDFLESYARKRQVLLTTDGMGNLILSRASTTVFPGQLKNVVGASDNNVLGGSFDTDDTGRFNRYVAQGQLNPFALDVGAGDVSSQNGTATDGGIRSSRVLEFNVEESQDSFTAKDRAKWESNIRRARSVSYSPRVQGHSVDGEIWTPNTLVEIEDQFADIEATMLCRSLSYQQSIDQGSTTKLDFTYKDAYTLQAEQDTREANTDKQGFGFG